MPWTSPDYGIFIGRHVGGRLYLVERGFHCVADGNTVGLAPEGGTDTGNRSVVLSRWRPDQPATAS